MLSVIETVTKSNGNKDVLLKYKERKYLRLIDEGAEVGDLGN